MGLNPSLTIAGGVNGVAPDQVRIVDLDEDGFADYVVMLNASTTCSKLEDCANACPKGVDYLCSTADSYPCVHPSRNCRTYGRENSGQCECGPFCDRKLRTRALESDSSIGFIRNLQKLSPDGDNWADMVVVFIRRSR